MKELFNVLAIENPDFVSLSMLQSAIDYVNKATVSNYIFFDNNDLRALTLGVNKSFRQMNFEEFCLLLTCNRSNCFENSSEAELAKIIEKFLQFSNNIRRKQIIHQLGKGEYFREPDDSKTLRYFKSLFDVPYFIHEMNSTKSKYAISSSSSLSSLKSGDHISEKNNNNEVNNKFVVTHSRLDELSMPSQKKNKNMNK